MKPLPLPVRVAAGLAVAAVERARQLPQQLAGLPVTVVSEALQLSMRLQQQVTELAIKGDDLLSALRPAEEAPAWATFDEDEPADQDEPASPSRAAAGARRGVTFATEADNLGAPDTAPDPWAVEEQALADAERVAEESEDAARDADAAPAADQAPSSGADQTPAEDGPAALPNYTALSLPQVRARMRGLSADELEQLLAFERSHAARPAFVGMLTRRIATVRAQS
ncbi:lipid droplet-associated protein [Goodfellowiella coeruleoviolacea]|uniref:Lipid droplet-associated protein n=1 Tax=Goodfellowiella coeruleoviolacea TaxID=334858 RepID=A0AAE3GE59_9PSEU|nr:lipid droplet-associated protein [Goodfellowiella coeruleoviolacea]MCP2165669.1 hypothetical protein [Goodfellowiella coeruleoviolacea]